MTSRLERDVRFLKLYAGATTLALLGLGTTAFVRAPARQKFQEIDVERINVVEPNGNYRMVIANRARSIGPIAYGKPFGYPGGTRPGIIFFNDEGTENGGLTFGGKTENGKFEAGGHLSFDQYNQDQVIYLTYNDQNGRRQMGLTVADRADVSIVDLVAQLDSIKKLPKEQQDAAARAVMAPRNGVPMFAQRVYVGRDPAKNALLNLSDPLGRVRLRLQVDSTGAASLQFLDADGKVTSHLP
jgi:hypothetical protein